MTAVFFVFLLARPALAAAKPARLEAEEVVFDYEHRILVATGNARLSHEDVVVRAERLEVDMDRNILVARGRVELATKEGSFSAEELVYDLGKEEGRADAFWGELVDEKTGEKIFFHGTSLAQAEEAIRARDLSLTTCDRNVPHYHFTAAEIDYYPGDKLILRRVYYWEGHFRLFYLPYLAFTLKERANYFSFPHFGYNEAEGLFLKLAYNFFVGAAYAGTLLLDLTERKGIGEGIRYAWEPGSGKEVWGSFYHLGDPTLGDTYRVETGLSLSWAKAKFQGRLGFTDETGLDGHCRTYQLGLNLAGAPAGPQGTLNYRLWNGPTRQNEVLDLGANGSWQLWKGATFSLQGRWYWSEDSVVGSSFKEGYEARFIQSLAAGTFSALLSSQVGPGYVSGYLPELRLELPRFSLGGLGNFALNLNYQRKIQETRILAGKGQRLGIDLTAQPRTLLAGGRFSLQATAWARARFYDTGEKVWGAAPELVLVAKLGEAWETRTGLSWIFTEGAPPSFFAGDGLTPRANLSLSLGYRRGGWQGRLVTGYALATGIWQNVAANLSWQGKAGDSLNLNTSYDPNTGLLGLTSFALGWRPKKDWSFRVNTAYDPASAQWRQLDLAVDLREKLKEDLTLRLATRYDFFQEAWLQAAVNFDYRWHCRTVSLGYDWARREITLSLWINAFPAYPMGVAYTQGGLFFTPPVMP
ncbi:MAG: hypothetical protein ACUVRM_00555 [Bacillota bacterium]